MSSNHHYYLAPLQGFTDLVYRRVYHRLFANIDAYYIPYISLGPGNKIRNSQLRELLPANNEGIPVVPQILCANVSEMRELAKVVQDNDYSELNLNMGCPYPMATNRGRGAALLEQPDELREILDALFAEFNFSVSIKFRAGLTNEQTIFQLIELLQAYPIRQSIFHPRTANQLYKGEANRALFTQLSQSLSQPLVYNGDLNTLADRDEICQQVPQQNEWMLGRGLLSDPFLVSRLKGEIPTATEQQELRLEFHRQVLEEYQRQFADEGQVLQKMKAFWSYFANAFSNPHKAYKPVKKASSLSKFKLAYPEIFRQYNN